MSEIHTMKFGRWVQGVCHFFRGYPIAKQQSVGISSWWITTELPDVKLMVQYLFVSFWTLDIRAKGLLGCMDFRFEINAPCGWCLAMLLVKVDPCHFIVTLVHILGPRPCHLFFAHLLLITCIAVIAVMIRCGACLLIIISIYELFCLRPALFKLW